MSSTEHDMTREEAIVWAIANNCDFKSPVLPPPQGWMWSGPGTLKHPSPNNIRTAADLVLTPIFTNTEDADITISDIKDITQ